eukprot:m.159598 g.159598  ORF g.159598 m.159598 type:complete len:166 (-) comp10266_c0_seq2:1354-1851(-)
MRRRRTELDTEGAEADEAAAESVTKGDAGEDDDDDSGSEFGDERSPHEQLDELTRLEEQLEKLDVAIEAGGPEGLKAAKARRSVARAHERLRMRELTKVLMTGWLVLTMLLLQTLGLLPGGPRAEGVGIVLLHRCLLNAILLRAHATCSCVKGWGGGNHANICPR